MNEYSKYISFSGFKVFSTVLLLLGPSGSFIFLIMDKCLMNFIFLEILLLIFGFLWHLFALEVFTIVRICFYLLIFDKTNLFNFYVENELMILFSILNCLK